MYTYNQEFLYFFAIKTIKISVLFGIGLLILFCINRFITCALEQRFTPHIRMLITKTIWYIGILLLGITLLNELGFQLSALLGAAGIFGIALGFASQTSMSNLISGLFLLSENFFAIGDVISSGSVQGTVESIDLFSIKMRTSDGKLVRIPHERLIKDNLTNETYYSLRRVEIALAVASNTLLDNVLHTIDVALQDNQYVVKKPKFVVTLQSVSADAFHFVVHIWTEHSNLIIMKNDIVLSLKKQLEASFIKILYIMVK